MNMKTLVIIVVFELTTIFAQVLNPVLWEDSSSLVAVGFKYNRIIFPITNPCENDLDGRLSSVAKAQCDRMYKEILMDKLERICRKRECEQNAITRIKRISPDMFASIYEEEKFAENHFKAVAMTENDILGNIKTKLTKLRADLTTTVPSGKQEIVSNQFVQKMANVSLQSEGYTDTHVSSINCCLSANKRDLSLSYSYPLYDNNLVVVIADAFKLRLTQGSYTCSIEYIGPQTVIWSRSGNCILMAAEIAPDLYSAHNLKDCNSNASIIAESINFKLQQCEKSRADDHKKYVQVKQLHGIFYIYCPGSEFTMEQRAYACPDDIFTLPATTKLWINNVKYDSKEFSYETIPRVQDKFQLLNFRVNMSLFKIPTEHNLKIKNEGKPFTINSSAPEYVIIGILFIILTSLGTLGLCVYCIVYIRVDDT